MKEEEPIKKEEEPTLQEIEKTVNATDRDLAPATEKEQVMEEMSPSVLNEVNKIKENFFKNFFYLGIRKTKRTNVSRTN